MGELVRARLRLLRDEYVSAVNEAVAEGRDDMVARLVADYPDAALRVITELEGSNAA
ncbi:hypothetical protein [Pseudonocardia pini]|uniref:hypothetical protein n=1 Tax=Pseudonocardia pini TaxID=2758030 RepID=UPI0015F06DF6|nr:hypothetical protein [Pseudonocardia pini]